MEAASEIRSVGVPMPQVPEQLAIGKGRIVREGKKVAILSLGTRLAEALKAADALEGRGLSATVADLRFAKPLDEALIRRLLTTHEVAVTIEEAAIGGLGAHVLTLASDAAVEVLPSRGTEEAGGVRPTTLAVTSAPASTRVRRRSDDFCGEDVVGGRIVRP